MWNWASFMNEVRPYSLRNYTSARHGLAQHRNIVIAEPIIGVGRNPYFAVGATFATLSFGCLFTSPIRLFNDLFIAFHFA